MKQMFCIIAGQRAGTTALHSAISGAGKFHDFGKIFHNGDARGCGAFVDYANDNSIKFTDLSAIHGQLNNVRYISRLR